MSMVIVHPEVPRNSNGAEQIKNAVAIIHRRSWQVVVHVTGDAGVDAVLDAIEAAQQQYPASDGRHTLIHAYFVHPEVAARAARLGVLVDTQPAWYYKDAPASRVGRGLTISSRVVGRFGATPDADNPGLPRDPTQM